MLEREPKLEISIGDLSLGAQGTPMEEGEQEMWEPEGPRVSAEHGPQISTGKW